MKEVVQIESAGDVEDALPEAIRDRLESLYARVPGVSCGCDKLGQCCELTPEEAADDWATMYPLYTSEYLNIVDYIRRHFSAEEQARVMSFTEERPLRCPFLTGEGGCGIHPARPLACRTYGVLSREHVEQTGSNYRNELPPMWVNQFLRNERCTVCAHTTLEEPEKLDEHAKEMVSFAYERALTEMGSEHDGLDEDRRRVMVEATGRERLVRWTWGGFNTLYQSTAEWARSQLAVQLKKSYLAE